MKTDISVTESILRPARRPALCALLVLLLGTFADTRDSGAFHDQGVARCGACHVTHEGSNDQIVMLGSDPLLLAATPTDVCLTCHGGGDGVFGLNPGLPPPERGAGNFVFLFEDNLNDAVGGTLNPIRGEAAGHSIISMDYGVAAESRWAFAPGGTFPVNQLGCTSCHDPHGNANFRMLNGVGPVQDGFFQFQNPAPLAEGLDLGDPLATEARDRHTAYRRGMSDWCANCHGLYHRDRPGPDGFEHDVNESLRGVELSRYNFYDGAANPTGGSAATAYLPEVPFEDPAMTTGSTTGPGPAARVMCLSCHRAHASSGPASGRWDFNLEALDQDGIVSGSWPLPNPYGDLGQPGLCVKCHRQQGPHDIHPVQQ